MSLKLPIPNLRPNLGYPGKVKNSFMFPGGGAQGQGLLGGLLGGLMGGGQRGVPYQPLLRATGSTLQTSDANITRIATTANVLTKHFQWKIPAGHSFQIPAGVPHWILIYADGAPGAKVNGIIQVRVMDPLESVIKNYFSEPTNIFSVTAADEGDVRKQPTIPMPLMAGSEDLLQVWINGDAAATGTTPGIGTAVESIWFRGIYT